MPARRIQLKNRGNSSICRTGLALEQQLKELLDIIEIERGNLAQAESLLKCLTIAMEYAGEATDGPYYPDVAKIACDMVRKTINAFDPLHLPDVEPDKVQEEFSRVERLPIPADPRDLRAPSRPIVATIPLNQGLRLHRRIYLRRRRAHAECTDLVGQACAGSESCTAAAAPG